MGNDAHLDTDAARPLGPLGPSSSPHRRIPEIAKAMRRGHVPQRRARLRARRARLRTSLSRARLATCRGAAPWVLRGVVRPWRGGRQSAGANGSSGNNGSRSCSGGSSLACGTRGERPLPRGNTIPLLAGVPVFTHEGCPLLDLRSWLQSAERCMVLLVRV